MPELAWYDTTGAIGAATIVGTYLLLRLGRISSNSLLYSLLNAAGAGLILVSLIFRFNLAAFLIECFWLLISLFGVAQALLPILRTQPQGDDV
jgi:hypothetical protein